MKLDHRTQGGILSVVLKFRKIRKQTTTIYNPFFKNNKKKYRKVLSNFNSRNDKEKL